MVAMTVADLAELASIWWTSWKHSKFEFQSLLCWQVNLTRFSFSSPKSWRHPESPGRVLKENQKEFWRKTKKNSEEEPRRATQNSRELQPLKSREAFQSFQSLPIESFFRSLEKFFWMPRTATISILRWKNSFERSASLRTFSSAVCFIGRVYVVDMPATFNGYTGHIQWISQPTAHNCSPRQAIFRQISGVHSGACVLAYGLQAKTTQHTALCAPMLEHCHTPKGNVSKQNPCVDCLPSG